MEMCLILIALYGLVVLASDVPAASRPWRDAGAARTGWLSFIGGSVAALDVLGDGLPWVLTANIVAGVLVWQSRNRGQLIRNVLAADAVIAALSAPFYVVMSLTQQEGFKNSLMWIPPLNISRFWYNIGSIYLMRLADSVTFRFMDVATPVAVVWIITAGLVMAVGFGAWRLRRNPAMLATLVISCAFLPLLLTVISLWRPVLLPRYILWSAAPFAILAGIGASWLIQTMPRRLQLGAVGAAAALLVVNLIPYYGAETKPRWDIAAKLLAQDVAPGDVVYLDDLGALPVLRLYLPAATQTVVLHDSDGDLQHAEQAQQQGKRVWAVFGHAGQSAAPASDWADFYAKMSPLGTPEQIQIAGNRIYITMFDPVSRTSANNCTMPPVAASAALPQGNCS
jgi:hypothetical protein